MVALVPSEYLDRERGSREWIIHDLVVRRAHEKQVIETVSFLRRLGRIVPRSVGSTSLDVADLSGENSVVGVEDGIRTTWKRTDVSGEGIKPVQRGAGHGHDFGTSVFTGKPRRRAGHDECR